MCFSTCVSPSIVHYRGDFYPSRTLPCRRLSARMPPFDDACQPFSHPKTQWEPPCYLARSQYVSRMMHYSSPMTRCVMRSVTRALFAAQWHIVDMTSTTANSIQSATQQPILCLINSSRSLIVYHCFGQNLCFFL